MSGSQNVRGIPPNRMARNVDAPRKYVSAPPDLPPRVKEEFDALVRLMPAGFYAPAHQDSLVQCCRLKLQIKDLCARQDAEGYDPVPMDAYGKLYQNPVELLLSKLRMEHHKWLTACRLTPSSAYNNKAVPRLSEDETKAAAADDDPELQMLRGAV